MYKLCSLDLNLLKLASSWLEIKLMTNPMQGHENAKKPEE